MRRITSLALVATVSLALLFVGVRSDPDSAGATHGNFNVHVHDSYYHPTGAFGVPTNHALAQAACEAANPDPECDTQIHVGDSVTWVSPAPLAAMQHTVTECTDNTFSVCGANVDPNNPIGDSGPRNPPSPGPSGWPYGPVQFNSIGTYYYLCTIHPGTMRGRVLVSLAATTTPVPPAVGGFAGLIQDEPDGGSGLTGEGWMLVAAGGGAVAATGTWLYLRRRRIG